MSRYQYAIVPVTKHEAVSRVRNMKVGSGYISVSPAVCFVLLLVCPRSLRVYSRGINGKGWFGLALVYALDPTILK